MALDYEEFYASETGHKNVVFCLHQNSNSKSQTGQNNQPLEILQKQLASEKEKGICVEKAFVCNGKKVCVKSFEETDQDGIYYQGYESCHGPVSHMVLIGLELLYQKQKADIYAENVLYLILNDECERTENNKILKILEQYKEQFDFVPVLIKNKLEKEPYGFEKFISEHGQICCHLDFRKVKL